MRAYYSLLFSLILLTNTVIAQEERVLEISQSDVIRRVLAENRRVRSSQIDTALAVNEIDRAKAALDTVFIASGSHEIDSSDRVVSVFGTRNDTTRFGASVRKLLPSGTGLSFGIDTTRQKSNSPFATVNPAYDTGLNFEITQSLWRDAFGKDLRGRIRASELQAEAVEEGVGRQIETIAYQAASTFWNWVAAREDGKLAAESKERARQFVKITNTKRSYGTAEERDVYASQANYAQFEEEAIRARQLGATLETQLKNQTMISETTLLRAKEVMPKQVKEESMESLVQRAKSKRGDFLASKKALEATKEARMAAEGVANPRLDLITSLRLNGVNGDWENSLGEPFEAQHPKFFVGAEMEMPWENRALGVESRRLYLEERQQSIELEQIEDDLRSEVLVAYDKVRFLNDRVAKLSEAEVLEKKKLKESERDFERGRTDALTITLYQQDLLRAQRSLLGARLQLALARLELSFVTGELTEYP